MQSNEVGAILNTMNCSEWTYIVSTPISKTNVSLLFRNDRFHFHQSILQVNGKSNILHYIFMAHSIIHIDGFIWLTYSGFIFLSFARITVRSIFSRVLSSVSSSFKRNSSEIISKSRTGSTSPSTCVTSGSSNAPMQMKSNKPFYKNNVLSANNAEHVALNIRHRWKMASQALMCERKAFPNPWPSAAPFTKPAISTTFK